MLYIDLDFVVFKDNDGEYGGKNKSVKQVHLFKNCFKRGKEAGLLIISNDVIALVVFYVI